VRHASGDAEARRLRQNAAGLRKESAEVATVGDRIIRRRGRPAAAAAGSAAVFVKIVRIFVARKLS